MTAKELQETLTFEAKSIQRLRERISQKRDGASKTPDTGSVPVQGGRKQDIVSSNACEIIRLEGLMQNHVDRVWEYMVYLDTPGQRAVIRFRYIEWMRWEKIALAMKYSDKHVYRLHWQAMRVICKKLATLP